MWPVQSSFAFLTCVDVLRRALGWFAGDVVGIDVDGNGDEDGTDDAEWEKYEDHGGEHLGEDSEVVGIRDLIHALIVGCGVA